ncbi:MAG: response regulator [Flavobacteriaceae bacterium]|nr:response regulator [Flavobacteriaceae bacterium]
MKNLYKKILAFGYDKKFNKIDTKRVTILNALCFYWGLLLVLLIFNHIFNTGNITAAFMNTVTLIGAISVLALQYHKKYKLATFLFFYLAFQSTFSLSNIISQGKSIEYFYIIMPPLALLFSSNKYFTTSILVISYLLFIIPNKINPIYPEEMLLSDIPVLVLFLIFYILINFFLKLNTKNELILEQKQKELEDLNEFQSQFFINISHEIRTPLTLINGHIDNIEDPKLKYNIKKQSSKIEQIVDDVIDLSKIKSSNFELNIKPTDIVELANKIQLSFEPLFNRKGIYFKFTKPKYSIITDIDSIFTERALNNIMSNALKFTEKNQTIIFKIEKAHNEVSLIISDTGIGISEDDLTKICNRFYQAKNDINKAGGSGIGLAFSKEIVNLSGGELYIKSELDKGSTFSIYLPISKQLAAINHYQPEHSACKIANIGNNSANNNLTNVLIVDDSFEMREYLKSLLHQYNLTEAQDGYEALDILKNNNTDLIITDYMMPKMDGFELIKSIQKLNYDIPTLMLTAVSDNKSKLKVLRLGIEDYINKPFEKEELLIRVNNIISNNKKRVEYINLQEEENKQEEHERPKNTEWVSKVIEYIEDNSNNPDLKQIDLILNFNISKSAFYRKIKIETGLTPVKFIREVKLNKARLLLEQDNGYLIKQVALEVGFRSTSYFTKIYQEHFGVKPENL